MTDEGMQDVLFGSVSTRPADGADLDAARGELRLCALNVNSPSRERAQAIAEWLLDARCNALVLTEMQPTEGCKMIMTCLEAEGFTVTRSTGWQDNHYFAVIATKGFQAEPVSVTPFTPRVTAADLTVGLATLRMVAIYGPTNGMTSDSSLRRRATQDRIITYLAAIAQPRMAVAGDLNVIEPGHRPHLDSFEDHDYSFYTRLLDLGLADAYRVMNPSGDDHSWFSDRLGSQRLDHALASPAAGPVVACRYDHAPRTRHLSDHAALLTTIKLATSGDDRSSS